MKRNSIKPVQKWDSLLLQQDLQHKRTRSFFVIKITKVDKWMRVFSDFISNNELFEVYVEGYFSSLIISNIFLVSFSLKWKNRRMIIIHDSYTDQKIETFVELRLDYPVWMMSTLAVMHLVEIVWDQIWKKSRIFSSDTQCSICHIIVLLCHMLQLMILRPL